jgi:hypothetical protein
METSRGLEKGVAVKEGMGATEEQRAVSHMGNRPVIAGRFSRTSVTVITPEVQVTA